MHPEHAMRLLGATAILLLWIPTMSVLLVLLPKRRKPKREIPLQTLYRLDASAEMSTEEYEDDLTRSTQEY